MTSKKMNRVVVTGIGAITPLGRNLFDTWQNLMGNQNGVGPITRFDSSAYKTHFACEVKSFDPISFFDKKELKKLDLFSQYSLVAADEAIRDAQLNFQKEERDNVGVIWSSGIGGVETFQEEIAVFAVSGRVPRFSPFFISKMIPDISSGLISIKYKLHGPNFNTVSACASSSNAIITAACMLKLGHADVIITGGAEAPIVESCLGGFGSMKALSERNDAIERASTPFDASRDGFVLGEGAGALVLETLDHALARGAKIYGEIAGVGMSGDAYHMVATHPEGYGARLSMEKALKDADISVDQIDYLNAHATSTPLGDASEATAIDKVFSTRAGVLPVSSTKSQTGHLIGAAGALEAIFCLLAIDNQTIPGNINLSESNINSTVIELPKAHLKTSVRSAMSNNFGFGGHNTSIVFRKWEAGN